MSGADDAIDYTDLGLEDLLHLLKDDKKIPYVRLGILGGKNIREGAVTNATIGAHHEFGTSNTPKRSFLRMPINTRFNAALEQAGGFDKETLEKVVDEKDFLVLLQKIGIVAEQVVADAFSSRGFGNWKESDMASKKNHQTLVESTQLRDSITSEVVTDV